MINENKKMQARYEEELQKARQQLSEERDRHLAEMEELTLRVKRVAIDD